MSENNVKELLTKPFEVTIIVTPEEILNELTSACDNATNLFNHYDIVLGILDVLIKYRLLNPDGYNVACSIDAVFREEAEERNKELNEKNNG